MGFGLLERHLRQRHRRRDAKHQGGLRPARPSRRRVGQRCPARPLRLPLSGPNGGSLRQHGPPGGPRPLTGTRASPTPSHPARRIGVRLLSGRNVPTPSGRSGTLRRPACRELVAPHRPAHRRLSGRGGDDDCEHGGGTRFGGLRAAAYGRNAGLSDLWRQRGAALPHPQCDFGGRRPPLAGWSQFRLAR